MTESLQPFLSEAKDFSHDTSFLTIVHRELSGDVLCGGLVDVAVVGLIALPQQLERFVDVFNEFLAGLFVLLLDVAEIRT